MKESQFKKTKSKVNWELMAQVSSDLFCTLDSNGFYSYVSEASENMLGYSGCELEGRHFSELLHEEDKSKTQQALQATVSSAKRMHFENRITHRDGTDIHVQWSAAWSKEDAAFYCVGRGMRDLEARGSKQVASGHRYTTSDLKEETVSPSTSSFLPQGWGPELADTLGQKPDLELSQLTKDLHKKNSDLQQFTYIVSHNLRAPVANALGLANMLATTEKDSTDFDRSLSFLRLSLYKMDAILKDMNTILSIRERKDNVGRERVDVKEVLLQAMTALKEQLQEARTTVNVDITNGLVVQANKAYLYSIFINLLSNSIKYRADGRLLEVNIKCRRGPHSGTSITFSDNGSGFDLVKNRSNVFKLYKRFHLHTQGRGMGLFLVKSHLDTMGGNIDVNSQVGIGTRFLINLP